MGYFWPTCTWPWVCVRIQKAVAGFFDNTKHQTRFSGLHDIRTSSNCSLTGHDLWCRPCWMGWFGDPAMQWKAKDVWITMWNIWLKIAKATSTKLSSGWRSWKMDHFSFLSWLFFGPSLLAENETSFFTTQTQVVQSRDTELVRHPTFELVSDTVPQLPADANMGMRT